MWKKLGPSGDFFKPVFQFVSLWDVARAEGRDSAAGGCQQWRSWETDNFQTYIKSISKDSSAASQRQETKSLGRVNIDKLSVKYVSVVYKLTQSGMGETPDFIEYRMNWLQDNFMMTKCPAATFTKSGQGCGDRTQNIYMKTIKMVRTVRVFSGPSLPPQLRRD